MARLRQSTTSHGPGSRTVSTSAVRHMAAHRKAGLMTHRSRWGVPARAATVRDRSAGPLKPLPYGRGSRRGSRPGQPAVKYRARPAGDRPAVRVASNDPARHGRPRRPGSRCRAGRTGPAAATRPAASRRNRVRPRPSSPRSRPAGGRRQSPAASSGSRRPRAEKTAGSRKKLVTPMTRALNAGPAGAGGRRGCGGGRRPGRSPGRPAGTPAAAASATRACNGRRPARPTRTASPGTTARPTTSGISPAPPAPPADDTPGGRAGGVIHRPQGRGRQLGKSDVSVPGGRRRRRAPSS